MFLVIVRRSGPEWKASRPLEEQSDWPAHAAFMDGLVDEGFIILGGPLADEERVAHAVEAASGTPSAPRSRAIRGARRTSASTRSTGGRFASTGASAVPLDHAEDVRVLV